MRLSLEIIKNNPFPIQVSSAAYYEEIENWIKDFKKKEIGIKLVPHRSGKVKLFREVTCEEIEEIKAGEVTIRGGSFQVQENEMRKNKMLTAGEK